MSPRRSLPGWGAAFVALLALGANGCGDTVTLESRVRVDVSACMVPSAAGAEAGAVCGSGLQEAATEGLVACLAHRVGAADRPALPLSLSEGVLRPLRDEAFELQGAARLTLRLYLLRPGTAASACAGYTVATPCQRDDPASPETCLLAFRPEESAISGDGRVAVTYGTPEKPCGIECNDLCDAGDESCRKLCWRADEPRRELCNGRDDDCDGEVDEDFGLGEACAGAGLCGAGQRECACAHAGTCDAANLADPRWARAICSSEPGGTADASVPERCNGVDDDCDGQVDEDWPSVGQACSAAGACGAGLFVCALDAATVCCDADPACRGEEAEPEVCNGVDDDCDGQVDEDLVAPAAVGCPQLGVCAGVAPACRGAEGWVCQFPELLYEATERSCDGQDNDCDGLTDEELAAPLADRQVGVCVGARKVCAGNAGWQEPEYSGQPNWELDESLCDTADNDCDGATDEGCACVPGAEQACGTDLGECSPGTQSCSEEGFWGPCVGGVRATAELCNQLDDDCDGETDEGNPEGGARCGLRLGECRLGLWLCELGELVCDGELGPSPEICDNRDNDCDGDIDEDASGGAGACGSEVGECSQGSEVCERGLWVCRGGVEPQPEVCNDLDDNCDGNTDEGNPGGGALCGSRVGECRQGLLACQGGALVCQDDVGPVPETCDNRDNDCNGLVDDAVPGLGQPCGSDTGECAAGVSACERGQVVCQGAVGPRAEICNGLDDDCDGSTDEALVAPVADLRRGVCAGQVKVCGGEAGWLEPDYGDVPGYTPGADSCEDNLDNDCDGTVNEGCNCSPDAQQSCGEDTGLCEFGVQTCDAQGEWGPCAGGTDPVVELCNGLDDDCDGSPDEDFELGEPCVGPGGAGAPCGAGVWECDPGTLGRRCSTAPGGSEDQHHAELCNGADDDCDGEVDEDFELGSACDGVGAVGSPCGVGVWECDPDLGLRRCSTHPGGSQDRSGPELCNGADDDCDGAVDETFVQLGEVCDGTGSCGIGVWECLAPGLQVICSTERGASQDDSAAETCDGEDDDCDGQVDEDFDLGGGCTGTGLCGPGVWECNLATEQRMCSSDLGGSQANPSPEVCDGLDNDCDGQEDEDLPTQTCGVGVCATVEQATCAAGVPLACDPLAGATAEQLDNGLDDDCDGEVDENPCVGGETYLAETGHCYWPTEADATWEGARALCQAAGGDLVSILSLAENGVVNTVRGESGNWWIGLSDLAEDGVWAWSDGEPLVYERWKGGEPNNWDTESCVRFRGNAADANWETKDCTGEILGICERVPCVPSPKAAPAAPAPSPCASASPTANPAAVATPPPPAPLPRRSRSRAPPLQDCSATGRLSLDRHV